MSRIPQSDPPLNRREFLGSSAVNAAGVAAGVVGWSGVAAAGLSPAERVRIAVIGVRNQGKVLATTLAALPDVDVAALCDVDESLLPVAGRAVEVVQGKAPRFEHDFRRLLDDRQVDAVVIAT